MYQNTTVSSSSTPIKTTSTKTHLKRNVKTAQTNQFKILKAQHVLRKLEAKNLRMWDKENSLRRVYAYIQTTQCPEIYFS